MPGNVQRESVSKQLRRRAFECDMSSAGPGTQENVVLWHGDTGMLKVLFVLYNAFLIHVELRVFKDVRKRSVLPPSQALCRCTLCLAWGLKGTGRADYCLQFS